MSGPGLLGPAIKPNYSRGCDEMKKTIVRLDVSRKQADAIEHDQPELRVFLDSRSHRAWGMCDNCSRYYVFGNNATNLCQECNILKD